MRRSVLFLSVLCMIPVWSIASDYIPIVREGVKWVYYEYVFNEVENEYIPTYYPIVYEFKSDETNPESNSKVLWEDRTYVTSSGEIQNDVKKIAVVSEATRYIANVDIHEVYAKKTDTLEPLVGPLIGQFMRAEEDGLVYKVYSLPLVQDHFDNSKLTKKQREELFTFGSIEMIEMEDGSLRRCWKNSKYPSHKLIEGIGYVVTDWYESESNNIALNLINFIDLEPRMYMSYRILSHVTENEEILFKGERYEEIQEHAYVPDKPNQNTGVKDIDAVVPDGDAGDGVYYDMQGRRVAEPTAPGIYIHNGKVVIK